MAQIELPPAITDIEARHPWEAVAERARRRLAELVPELSDEVSSLDGRVFGLTSGFFYLPAAQAKAWGVRDSGWIEPLLTTLAIGHAHFAVQDAVVDTGSCSPGPILLSDVCLLEYLDSIERLAPSPGYRSLHDSYYRWYLKGIANELTHRATLHPYTPSEISELGFKAAPGNTVIHLVADAARRGPEAPMAVRAVMQLCTGLQLLDDLNDIDEDHNDGNLTMPLTATLLRMRDRDRSRLRPGDLSVSAVISGVASGCVTIAKEYFTLAETSAASAGADVISDLARTWLHRADVRLGRINEAVAREARAAE